MALIDRVNLKGRYIVVPNTLQEQELEELHINHMGMEKTKLLVHESIYCPGINNNNEKYMKNFSTCLEFWKTKPKEQIMHHKILGKPWEVVGADLFTSHNKTYHCIVDYHSKFPIIKKTEDLTADILILACELVCQNIAYQEK